MANTALKPNRIYETPAGSPPPGLRAETSDKRVNATGGFSSVTRPPVATSFTLAGLAIASVLKTLKALP